MRRASPKGGGGGGGAPEGFRGSAATEKIKYLSTYTDKNDYNVIKMFKNIQNMFN